MQNPTSSRFADWRGPQREAYRELERLQAVKATIQERLRTTDRGGRVYTTAERERLLEIGRDVDQEIKRLRRDLNQAEAAPSLFGVGLPFARRIEFSQAPDGTKPCAEFLRKLPRAERLQLAEKLHYLQVVPELPANSFELIERVPFVLGEFKPKPFRILAHPLRDGHTFLAVHMFRKQTQKLPDRERQLARNRIAAWYADQHPQR